MENKSTASTLLTCAGTLMSVSGILMAICAKLAYGGIAWVGALCMFFAAWHFRLAENKKNETEESDDEQTTV